MTAPTATRPNIHQLVNDADAGPDGDGVHDSYVTDVARGWFIHCTTPGNARDVALHAIRELSLYDWSVTVEAYPKQIRHPWRTVDYTHRVVVVAR